MCCGPVCGALVRGIPAGLDGQNLAPRHALFAYVGVLWVAVTFSY
jgi:hypothetical protein